MQTENDFVNDYIKGYKSHPEINTLRLELSKKEWELHIAGIEGCAQGLYNELTRGSTLIELE